MTMCSSPKSTCFIAYHPFTLWSTLHSIIQYLCSFYDLYPQTQWGLPQCQIILFSTQWGLPQFTSRSIYSRSSPRVLDHVSQHHRAQHNFTFGPLFRLSSLHCSLYSITHFMVSSRFSVHFSAHISRVPAPFSGFN